MATDEYLLVDKYLSKVGLLECYLKHSPTDINSREILNVSGILDLFCHNGILVAYSTLSQIFYLFMHNRSGITFPLRCEMNSWLDLKYSPIEGTRS